MNLGILKACFSTNRSVRANGQVLLNAEINDVAYELEGRLGRVWNRLRRRCETANADVKKQSVEVAGVEG